MTSTGFLGEGSPDACDAAVWALSDLMVVAHAPLWAAISGLLFSMTLAHGGTCHVYQDGADTVQACEDGSSRSPTRTATGAFMANPTQVLIGIPARVNAGAAIAAAGVAVPNGTESVPNGTVCN